MNTNGDANAQGETIQESRMRENRKSGLTRGRATALPTLLAFLFFCHRGHKGGIVVFYTRDIAHASRFLFTKGVEIEYYRVRQVTVTAI